MKRFALALALILTAVTASAVGTITFTALNLTPGYNKYTVAWVSDASGDVSGNATQFVIPRGRIHQAQFTPDSGGTQPTDLYDATLLFSTVDILDGVAANLSDTTATIIMFDPPFFYDATSNLDLVISNAGNAKGGTFVLWITTP